MSVNELNANELDELRWSLYWEDERFHDIAEVTDGHVFDAFSGICFVKDDFGCNQAPLDAIGGALWL